MPDVFGCELLGKELRQRAHQPLHRSLRSVPGFASRVDSLELWLQERHLGIRWSKPEEAKLIYAFFACPALRLMAESFFLAARMVKSLVLEGRVLALAGNLKGGLDPGRL